MEWFTVDKQGLAKLLEKRGKAFAFFELIQNGWDTDATRIEVNCSVLRNKPYVLIEVKDDHPDGFSNLTHAFTLFAPSEKKGNPLKRGRFNLGEKLVLALCQEASVSSTTGTIVFDDNGRHTSKLKTETGSVFKGTMRMTREEFKEVQEAVMSVIPPAHVQTYFNDQQVPVRPIKKEFEATLSTVISDDEGNLKPTARRTLITVHDVTGSEVPMLYEMGIPVVELAGGMRWHVNVHQKIPLSMDRDNVTPSYLQTLRVFLANAMAAELTADDTQQVWIDAATGDERAEPKTVETMLKLNYGVKRAVFDPSDSEANKQLMNEGYTIIPGRALSKGQWNNVKASSLALPAGQIRPSGVKYSADGKSERLIEPSQYTTGQGCLVSFVEDLAERLLNKTIQVRIVNEPIARPYSAWYGGNTITFNLGRLGKQWFEEGIQNDHLELIIHEFAHDKVSDHLTKDFADEACRLFANLLRISLQEPMYLTYAGYKA